MCNKYTIIRWKIDRETKYGKYQFENELIIGSIGN